MTTIICNSVSMVSDSKIVDGETHYPGHKVFKRRGCLVGTAGDGSSMQKFLEWFEAGADPKKRPAREKGDGTLRAMVLHPDGKISVYDEACIEEHIARGIHAVGTGGPIALGAMEGANMVGGSLSLEMAVEVACRIDVNSGGPVQPYLLADAQHTLTKPRSWRRKG